MSQNCLRVKKYVFGVCNFVDVVYLFLHAVVRNLRSAPVLVRSRFLFKVCVISKNDLDRISAHADVWEDFENGLERK